MECVFCRIVNRQLPAEVLFESNRVLSILDIRPIHYGHALVMPKLHCVDFLSVDDSDLQEVTHVTQLVARAIVEALNLKGFNVFSNNGKVAGQSVFHFHMHITPRYADDNIKFVLTLKEYQTGDIGAYAERIREHMALARRV
jgi:histidine triad (HIT) family protein